MKTYSQVEGMLYSYYRKKKRISSLRSRLTRVENRINSLRRDIKECNVDLGETMKAIDYSSDASGSNSITSNIERELERAVDNIIREIEYGIREKYKTMSKIKDLEKQADNIDVLFEELAEEELQILELRYSEKLSDNTIGDMINMSRPTVQRKRIDLVNNLSEEIS